MINRNTIYKNIRYAIRLTLIVSGIVRYKTAHIVFIVDLSNSMNVNDGRKEEMEKIIKEKTRFAQTIAIIGYADDAQIMYGKESYSPSEISLSSHLFSSHGSNPQAAISLLKYFPPSRLIWISDGGGKITDSHGYKGELYLVGTVSGGPVRDALGNILLQNGAPIIVGRDDSFSIPGFQKKDIYRELFPRIWGLLFILFIINEAVRAARQYIPYQKI